MNALWRKREDGSSERCPDEKNVGWVVKPYVAAHLRGKWAVYRKYLSQFAGAYVAGVPDARRRVTELKGRYDSEFEAIAVAEALATGAPERGLANWVGGSDRAAVSAVRGASGVLPGDDRPGADTSAEGSSVGVGDVASGGTDVDADPRHR